MNAAAIDALVRKALVGSGLDTAGWDAIAAAVRDRAFFSATVTELNLLAEMRQHVMDIVGSGKSMSEARRDLRSYLAETGYLPDEGMEGTIKDLRTKARLDVMLKTNADQAKGYAQHLRATTAGAILAFPGYELFRVQQRKLPRDWGKRWQDAGNAVGWQGACRDRMIALKTSPIWAALSRFGNPFPPFDFNSGMGVRDVRKSVCRELGLLGENEQPEIPEPPKFNGNLESRIAFGPDSPEGKRLTEIFGAGRVRFTEGKAEWNG